MKKRYIIAGVCSLILLAVAAAVFLWQPWVGQGTRISFTASESGFRNETQLYTEGGLTNIRLTGEISVNGTAEVLLVSEEDGVVVYSKTFTDTNKAAITVEADNLRPDSCYNLVFAGKDAKSGYLFLTTEQSLALRPERPERNRAKMSSGG